MPAEAMSDVAMPAAAARRASSLNGEKLLSLDTDSADGARMMRSHGSFP